MSASRGSGAGSNPTIYCGGRKTIALQAINGDWRCYWCAKRVRIVWPI